MSMIIVAEVSVESRCSMAMIGPVVHTHDVTVMAA